MSVQSHTADSRTDHITDTPIPGSAGSEAVILRDIAFEPDVEKLKEQLRIREGTRYEDDLAALLNEAQAIARPKAMYRVAYVDSRNEDGVVVDGIPFHSRVLSVNLEGTNRVFPFAVTAGQELHEWSNRNDDLLIRYYADVIAETALRAASDALKRHLDRRYAIGRSSTMSPGSLSDWPIQEQRPLFRLLGDPEEAIGSGFRFAVENSFESCQLCRRERCPNRRAPYDEGLYERRYRLAQKA